MNRPAILVAAAGLTALAACTPPPPKTYPVSKALACGTATISIGGKGEIDFAFAAKPSETCPCTEFGWIQHFSNADQEAWRYDNGVLSATAGRTGAISDPSKTAQPTTPPAGTPLKDWDANPWYGGSVDPNAPKDFGEHPTPQAHISDLPTHPNTKYRTQLVCVATGQVYLTWAWGPFRKGNEAPESVAGESVAPP